MSMSDTVADMLTRIRNGQQASKVNVSFAASKHKTDILHVLKGEGYITDYSTVAGVKPVTTVVLKYYQGKPVISTLKRISRPGLRIFRNKDELPSVMNDLGIAIISTSKGVMSNRAANSIGEGGEVICVVE